jgi:hypothetical protein
VQRTQLLEISRSSPSCRLNQTGVPLKAIRKWEVRVRSTTAALPVAETAGVSNGTEARAQVHWIKT